MEKKTNKVELKETKKLNETPNSYSVADDPKVKEFEKKLYALRKDGVLKVSQLQEEMLSIRKNKMVDKATKDSIIAKDKEAIIEAKKVAKRNKEDIKQIVEEATKYVKLVCSEHEKEVKATEDARKEQHNFDHKEALQELEKEHKAKIAEINERFSNSDGSKEDVSNKKDELKNESFRYKSTVYDENARFGSLIQHIKDNKYNAFNEKRNEVKRLRNGKSTISETLEYKWKSYLYQFVASKFLINNALYIVILVFFIFCCIYAPISNHGNLLSIQNIFNILENSSTRMFYALGVAGLILIAGTDLSIGRMVALGSVTTAVILHSGDNIVQFFGLPTMNFDAIPMFVRVAMALILSIILCTTFSLIAGFFTARFKMHPFISTLSTQLIIYGLLFFATSGTSTGNIDSGIKDMIGGRWYIGSSLTFPKLIIPMILIIIVIWFIWNKTRFGKNMYAVGGNAEAASVSGINVFKTTLLIFVLAGICYGCGSFLEAFRANTSAGTGQGFELDAIAACVVGGISFSGGIGKVKGAVIGVFIFTALTYALNFLQIDTNLQFVFKGVIILAAVSLDCVKYLKKK